MAKTDNGAYTKLRQDISEDTIGRLYVFRGQERYLLEYYLRKIRERIPEGTEEFNLRRFESRDFSLSAFSDAVDAFPAFSDFALVEVWDYDISSAPEDTRKSLLDILSDIPEYICVIFVYDTVEFKLDTRSKINSEIKKLMSDVEFQIQEKDEIIKWISRHFRARGKKIDYKTAEKLAFMTGGLMTDLGPEIEKLTAYNEGEVITPESLDAVITPVIEAATYELTDRLLGGDRNGAVSKLAELMAMDEPPHRILYGISDKMRQLLGVKLMQKYGGDMGEFMQLFRIRYDFQARRAYSAAASRSITECTEAVRLCAETAYKLNRNQNTEGLLQDLVLKLIYMDEGKYA